jgi:HAMP domain-containing protein
MGPAFSDRTGGANRRRFMRVHPSVLATRVATREVSQIGILVENIGLGGAYLRTDKPLPVGEPIDLELARPGQQALVKLHGRVVSAVKTDRAVELDRPPGMGISFGTLDERTRESLKALIRSFVPENVALETGPPKPFKLTAAAPEPVSALPQGELPAPLPMPPPSVPRRDESSFLKGQVRSLMQQIGDLHDQLNAKANEIDALHTAVERLQQDNGALRRKIDGRN